jgi:hypothetical protein
MPDHDVGAQFFSLLKGRMCPKSVALPRQLKTSAKRTKAAYQVICNFYESHKVATCFSV